MRGREILLAAFVALGPSLASAQAKPDAIEIRWRAPEGCPDAIMLRGSIERLLGGPPKPTNRPLSVDGSIAATGGGAWVLELALASGPSRTTRTLHGASCATLTEAGALLIALAFDPDAVAAQEAKQEAPAEPPPPPDATPAPQPAAQLVRIPVPPPATAPAAVPPQAPRAQAPVDTRAQRPDPGWRFGALVGLTVDAGSLPAVAPGLRTGFALAFGAYRIEPFLELWPYSERALADRPSQGARIRLWVGALRGCRRLLPWTEDGGAFALSGCAGVEAGEMRGSGFGVASPGEGAALWVAPRAELVAGLSIVRPVALTADLGVAAPLDARRFVLDLSNGRAVVHEPAPVALRAALGLAAHF